MKQLKLPDEGCSIKGLFICNGLTLEPLDLLNGLVLGSCHQPNPEVGIPRSLQDLVLREKVSCDLKLISFILLNRELSVIERLYERVYYLTFKFIAFLFQD